jgi:PAS domain S-box-containing protein
VLDETLFEEMKRYVRFTDADAALLAAFRPHAAPHFEEIAREFYDRIREHEGAHEVFTGEPQVERLKRSLVRWLERVCTGPHDQRYFEETAKIGRMHVRVGLPQHYMFTAMALIRGSLVRLAQEALAERARPTIEAVNRALDLELAVMLETYRDDYVARLHRLDRQERAEVDRTLARTEHRYQHAVELARVLFVGLDAHARLRLYNREAERVTGFRRDEVMGTPFVDLLPDALRDEHGPFFARAAAGDAPASDVLESAIRTRSGKVRDVRWQIAYSPSEADDEVVLFAVGHDTTDENALAARVRQSEKLAAVGTLAAGLAHEIRNPLNGAHLHLTFLERGLKRAGVYDADALEAVRVVGEEIKRLGGLVSEFLDFARPRPLEKRPSSLRALCERAVQLVAPDAEAGAVQIALDLPATDLELELDGAKIEQVLLNLLRNAIEAVAPGGGGSVIVRARRQPRQAVIEVEDDGPGLPSPEAPIFDAFFSTKPHGTGLGLAIAHRIVTDHGGTIDAAGRPGATVFRITLPIRLT